MALKEGFSDILRFVNNLALQLELDKVLEASEALFIQLAGCKNLSNEVVEILGL